MELVITVKHWPSAGTCFLPVSPPIFDKCLKAVWFVVQWRQKFRCNPGDGNNAQSAVSGEGPAAEALSSP